MADFKTPGVPIRAVLFDWDGTVADTRPGIFNSVRYAIGEHGIPDKPDDELRYFIGPPLYDGFEHVFGVDDEMATALTDTYRVYYRDRGIFECNIYAGVGDLLRELHDAGIKTAVVSSKPKEFLDKLIEHFGFADCLDAVVGPGRAQRTPGSTPSACCTATARKRSCAGPAPMPSASRSWT